MHVDADDERSGAQELKIAGLVPLSSTDWPDNLAAVLFLQGCPLACEYCQNVQICDMRQAGSIPFDEVASLLRGRRGLLDGVVFSGGEPLAQRALVGAIKWVKKQGFAIGLHTSGAYPARLAEIAPMLSWCGLDIKSLPAHYPRMGGKSVRLGENAWECITILNQAHVDYEVRLTIYPWSPVLAHFDEICEKLAKKKVRKVALQYARSQGTPDDFSRQLAAYRVDKAQSMRWEEDKQIIENKLAHSPFDTIYIRA